jgi:hypothetical protein
MSTAVEISRKVSASRTGATVTRVIDVEPYNAWYTVVSNILGGVRLVGRTLIRIPPYGDPYLPWAFADSVDVEGVGVFTGIPPSSLAVTLNARNIYRRARLTINYKTLEATENDVNNAKGGDDNGDQEMELANQSMDFSSKHITVPNSNLRFRYSPVPLPPGYYEPITKTIPQIKMVFARHLVINRPVNAITSLIGRINYSSFRIGPTTWPAETLRFDGANTRQKITNLGIKFNEITYTFSVMPVFANIATSNEVVNVSDPKIVNQKSTLKKAYVGWNRFWRGDRGYWDRLVAQSDDPEYQFRQVYEYDKDIKQNLFGGLISGFRLLFHPAAI